MQLEINHIQFFDKCNASIVFLVFIKAASVASRGRVNPNDNVTNIDILATSIVVNPCLKYNRQRIAPPDNADKPIALPMAEAQIPPSVINDGFNLTPAYRVADHSQPISIK